MNKRTEQRHTLHQHQSHIGWNNAQEPLLIVHPGKTVEFHPVDAHMRCSVCADLRISEIVDPPNWAVSLYFPRVVFE